METIALTFGSPLWLWALLAVPALAGLYAWAHLRSRSLVGKIVAPRLRERLAGSVSPLRRAARATLVLAAVALAIVAMAQPRYGFIEREIKQKGRDIIVAVDTSRSMLATDIAPTRLARAKLLTQDLIRLLKGDRVGLVAFAGSAFLQAPLTLDYSAVINALDELDTNVIPKGGTNLAAAIAVAEQAFGKAEGQTRALIILTDGEELDADGTAAAKTAAAAGIRIFTVGIGSPEGSLIPFRSDDGRQDFVRDASGKPVQSKLDEARLRELAQATGGFYVPISPDAAREIFQNGIEPMDLAETGVFAARQPIERYQWPLGLAVALLVAWMLLGERRRPLRALALAALLLPATTQAADSGLQSYEAGDYEAARSAFENHLKSAPDSREAQFNAGASAYKLGDFEHAISRFTSALLSEDKKLREDSAYNLGNALVRRGEAAKDTPAKKADWKNAIEQYSEALALNPKNQPAEKNREIVKKLLEDLEKQEQQKDDKKDDQKQDQKQDQKDQKDQKDQQDQKNDQQKDQQDQKKDGQKDQDQKNQDQKDQDQKDQKDGQKDDQKDQQGGGEKDKPGQKDDQKKEDGDQGAQKKEDQKDGQKDESQGKPDEKKGQPTPSPTPGEKKEGEVKSGQKGEEKPQAPQPAQGAAPGEEQEKDGEMSAAQARALLKSLNSEEEKVNLMQQPYTEETLRDW